METVTYIEQYDAYRIARLVINGWTCNPNNEWHNPQISIDRINFEEIFELELPNFRDSSTDSGVVRYFTLEQAWAILSGKAKDYLLQDKR